MYSCINCGANVEELCRRYSPSVLKVSNCKKCGQVADKYIEYDPVIVLIDIVLLEKPAYRHLLYNENVKIYWKLIVFLLLGESFKNWFLFTMDVSNSNISENSNNSYSSFEGEKIFYIILAQTTISLAVFFCAMIVATEIRWLIIGRRPKKYRIRNLGRALIIGGCAKFLGLVGIIWQKTSLMLHYPLIHGYTILCLLTAYSVVCESGRVTIANLIGLSGGLVAYNYIFNGVVEATVNFL